MPVLDRNALEASPLADLHALASELSIDGYRRLRREELIDAILDKQGGGDAGSTAEKKPRRTRSRRTASTADSADEKTDAEKADAEKPSRSARSAASEEADDGDSAPDADTDRDEDDDAGARRRRGRRGGRGRSGARADADADAPADRDGEETESANGAEASVEGVVELLAGGSGFVRVNPPEPSDDDVYISSAQVKRCELVSGDRVAGPKRAPRRSERFASLIRVETINGRPAAEQADSVRFDDLPAACPAEVIKLGAGDPTLKAIEGVTPFGKGSRVSIVGPARSGKTEVLRRLVDALAPQEDLTVTLVLAGARPEEITESQQEGTALTPAAAEPLTASEETINNAIETVVDQGRRLAARGSDAVVLIDSLDRAGRSVARRALGAARNIVDGGSLTVIAVSSVPVGGETTVIALDAVRAASAKFPALDVLAGGVVRPELLVGDRGAKAIARAHVEASKPEKK